MNATALKALAALVPACLLLTGSALLFSKACGVRLPHANLELTDTRLADIDKARELGRIG